MPVLFAVAVIFALLVMGEIYSKHFSAQGEHSRKFVHITVGSFVAFWPFFLTWQQIELLSILFLVAVGVSRYFDIFSAIHSVQRPTWGEAFFALAVGIIAVLTHSKGIYAAALLQMSLADGLAAVVGVRYGKSNSYLVFGHKKSIVGTLTFFVVSVLLLVGFSHWSLPISAGLILLIASVATIIENLAIKGIDNLLVPLVVALLLISHLG